MPKLTRLIEINITAVKNAQQEYSGKLAKNAADPNISESLREERAAKIGQEADGAVRTIRALVEQLAAQAHEYHPGPERDASFEGRITRAAVRAGQLLDSGSDLHEVLALAARSGDAPMVEALREFAPARIHMDTRGLGLGAQQEAHKRLAEFEQDADLTMARVLRGTPEGEQAEDALTARALAQVAYLELDAASRKLAGNGDPLGDAVAVRYARDAVAAVHSQIAGADAASD